jgi:hypothetical protein
MNTVTMQKNVPVTEEVDVVVVGGGIAGISAALAAAFMGSKVLLVEHFAVFGGNATSGGVASFCGNTKGQGKAFDMIVAALKEFNAIVPRHPGQDARIFNHEILAVILPELLEKNGVRMLLHTEFVDVGVSDGMITEVFVSGRSGLEAIRAKQVIDCTGDGFVALRAGFQTMKGDSRGFQLPMSLMYFVRHVAEEDKTCEVPAHWFSKIETEDDLPMTSIWPNGKRSNAIKIKIPMYDSTDTRSMTKAEINGRRRMMSVLDYHQRKEDRNFILDHGPSIIGIREGCRIVGDYILTVDDVRAGRAFDDVIAVGTYYLDGHKPDDDKRTYILPKDELSVPPYDIPLRCLIAKDGKNLMMAGRCLSADQLALSSARVMTTCSMTGQAAGVTAALAAAEGIDIRNVGVARVQAILKEGGAELDKSKVSFTR